MKPKVVVAMSGGVDSSVAAALLVEQGYDVTGIMLKLWKGEAANNNSGCCNLDAASDARRVADAIGIPFYVLNFAERFEDTVVKNFHEDYSRGRTPNPCVRCNQWIKFDALLEKAQALGAEYLATGHYARVRKDGARYSLLRGIDEMKDQSYVLWMLDQSRLARTLFPVGEMTKAETRARAEGLGLRTARKPDSQEICFVRNGDFAAHIAQALPSAARPGPVIDAGGVVVGEHAGAVRYTIGQRKGLGLSLGVPVFVTSIDTGTNTVTVGDRGQLAIGSMTIDELVFTDEPLAPGTRVNLQYRAHGEVVPAIVAFVDRSHCEIALDDPAYAVAPGQSAALYSASEPDRLVGGGVISSTIAARRVAGVA